ncbi:hypothetical protein F5Y19DRAFT_470584 [Xylariaceae sp. FL1651]|nr:hypothetical protein F5Y19DRAFT_470584 [Xylariaceae sp. FL1651]
MISIIGIGLRAVLLLAAAVVLGLSVTLAKYQKYGSVPPETGFSIFVGTIGFFASTVGMATMWFDRINGKILIGLDMFVAVLYFAAAISFTVGLRGVSSCTSTHDNAVYSRITNQILSGGCVETDKGLLCLNAFSSDGKDLTPSRCYMAHTDYIFEYAGFLLGFAMAGLSYILYRRGRGGVPIAQPSYI